MNYWTHEIHTLARVGETTLPPPDPTPPKAIFAERKQVRPDGHAVACVLVYTTVGQASSIDCLLGCEVSPVSVFRPKGINTYQVSFYILALYFQACIIIIHLHAQEISPGEKCARRKASGSRCKMRVASAAATATNLSSTETCPVHGVNRMWQKRFIRRTCCPFFDSSGKIL